MTGSPEEYFRIAFSGFTFAPAGHFLLENGLIEVA
jgi:hypothetical protein